MRKLSLTCLLLSGLGLAQNVPILLNGQALQEAQAIRSQGVVMVPLRGVLEKLGAQVKYEAGTITALKEGVDLRMKLGSLDHSLNAQTKKLTQAPVRVAGKTYVPLRVVAEALGAKVGWDGKQVSISAGDQAVAVVPNPPPVAPPADLKVRLKRLSIGNQAGILKIYGASASQVLFFRGIDDRGNARISDEHRHQILTHMGYSETQMDAAVDQLMGGWDSLPKREAVALLAVFGSSPQLSASKLSALQRWVASRASSEKDVAVRRQAILSLALMRAPSPEAVQQVITIYERSNNLWETFPVQQFFEYHAASVRGLPDYANYRRRLSAVESLYTSYLLEYLDSAVAASPRREVRPRIGY
jgi:hypothetical protein